MHLCRECEFYRPFRPVTQLLARDLGLDDKNVLSELVKMMQDEREKQDGEAKLIPAIRRDGRDRWDVRPSMSDFCVVDPDSFVVPSIRNQQGDCASFRKREDARDGGGLCATCARRVQPDGPQDDEKVIDQWLSIAKTDVAFGKDEGTATKAIDDVRETAGVRKSFEASQSYYAGKVTFRPPRYLAYCREYSTPTDFVPCVVANPHERCSAWAAAQGPRDARRSGR